MSFEIISNSDEQEILKDVVNNDDIKMMVNVKKKEKEIENYTEEESQIKTNYKIEDKYTQTKNETTGEINVPNLGEYVFTEDMPSIEINSIKRYGGFYIGRYEVGVDGATQDLSGYDQDSFKAPSEEWTGWKNGKAVVQKDKQVWNYITRDMAKKIAEEMYSNNDVVESRLCSSYAWDTALKFIDRESGTYAINSQ